MSKMTFDFHLVKPSISCIPLGATASWRQPSTGQSEGELVRGGLCAYVSHAALSRSAQRLCWFERKRGQLPDTDSVRWNERSLYGVVFFFSLSLFLLTLVIRKRHHGTGADWTGLPLSQRNSCGIAERTEKPLLKLKLCLGKRSGSLNWFKCLKKKKQPLSDLLIYTVDRQKFHVPRLSAPCYENSV